MKKQKYRIAVINSHPIQYFAPLYAYLNASESLDITALYCSDFSLRGGHDRGFKRAVVWDLDLLSGYHHKFLGEAAKKRVPAGFWSLVCPEVWREIRSNRYDAILVHGHNYAVNLLAMLAAKTRGIKVMMRGETHLGLQRSGFKRFFRKFLIWGLYYYCDRCLAIGSLNYEFYRAMGVPDEKIFLVPYAVDNKRFSTASSITSSERVNLRKKYGFREDQVLVLYASKFDRRKRPDDVIRAVALLQREGLNVALLMVGSGEMESQLQTLASSLELDNIFFAGFINQLELPRIYAASDIFTLPSVNEPWGLIVNEVMCSQLPVIVCDEVGCVPDLVIDGQTGFTHKAGDLESLASALRKLASDSLLRAEMGHNCRIRMEHWSYTNCLQGILAALQDGHSK